ncbi:MAG TPA: tetratricopeptide repeat protein [Kofleriaceae bacterium]|nr:tetratricopeptide repeat protein [Kofleriaceae bacterium]
MGGKAGRATTKASSTPRKRDPIDEAHAAVAAKQPERALQLLRDAYASARTNTRRAKLQGALRDHGNTYMWREDWPHAIAFYEAALAGHRDGDDTELVGEVANQACWACLRAKRLDDAIAHGERALAWHREAGRWRGVGIAHYYLAGVEFERGRVPEAIAHAGHALAATEQTGDQNQRVAYLTGVAAYHYHAGNTVECEQLARQALPLAEALGMEGYEAHLWVLLGNVALDDGRLDDAEQRYAEAEQRFRRGGQRNDAAIATGNLGNLALERGDLALALERLDRAAATHEKEHDERSLAIVLTDRGAVKTELGDHAGAQDDLDTALAILERLGHTRRVGFVRGRFAKLAEAREAWQEARAHYAEMEIALDAVEDRVELARMLYAAAGVEAELGDSTAADALIARADELAAQVTSAHGTRVAHALREVALARREVGHDRAAAARLAAIDPALLAVSSELRRVAIRLRRAIGATRNGSAV